MITVYKRISFLIIVLLLVLLYGLLLGSFQVEKVMQTILASIMMQELLTVQFMPGIRKELEQDEEAKGLLIEKAKVEKKGFFRSQGIVYYVFWIISITDIILILNIDGAIGTVYIKSVLMITWTILRVINYKKDLDSVKQVMYEV